MVIVAQFLPRTGAGVVYESEIAQALSTALLNLKQEDQLQAELRDRCLDGAQQYERNHLACRMAALLQQGAA